MKPIAIYARVSTPTQNLDGQLRQLRGFADREGFSSVLVFTDIASGARSDRPGYRQLCETVDKKRVGAVVVWDLSRLARRLAELIRFIERLDRAGVDFVCLEKKIDTRTPAGRLLFQLTGAFYEFELERTSARIRAGLDRARAEGIDLGRPAIDRAVVLRIHQRRAAGDSIRSIAKSCKVSTRTVRKYLTQKRDPQ